MFFEIHTVGDQVGVTMALMLLWDGIVLSLIVSNRLDRLGIINPTDAQIESVRDWDAKLKSIGVVSVFTLVIIFGWVL